MPDRVGVLVAAFAIAMTAVLAVGTTALAAAGQSAVHAFSEPSTPQLIERDVRAGKVGRDKAAVLLAYAIGRPGKLPQAYRSDTPWDGTLPLLHLQERIEQMDPGLQREEATDAITMYRGSCLDHSVSLPNEVQSDHFYVEHGPIGGGLTVEDYLDSLDGSWEKHVNSFGWAAPPVAPTPAPGGKYHVRIGDLGPGLYGFVSSAGAHAGLVGNNPATPWNEGDAHASCMVLNSDFSSFPGGPQNALDATTAHEFNHSIQFGYGAPWGSNIPDDVFFEGGATWMEDEVHDSSDDNRNYLWPNFTESMGDYDASPYQYWITFRGLTERYGTGVANGGEQVMQDFWEETSKNEGNNVSALATALANQGTTLADAFHAYSIAVKFNKACGGGYAYPYCFEEGPAYVAAKGPTVVHKTIAGIGGSATGTVEDDYALNWVALPASGSYEVTLRNTSAGGRLRGTVACDTGTTLRRSPLPAVARAGESVSVGFSPAACAGVPVLAITNEAQSPGNPGSSPSRSYEVLTEGAAVVTNLADAGVGSLRSAISEALTTPAIDEVLFDSSIPTGTIALQSRLQDLTKDMEIRGPGADRVSIAGGFGAVSPFRVFAIDAGASVKITDLAMKGKDDLGGGILNRSTGTLVLERVLITESHATNSGGAIFNEGSLTVEDSVIASNAAVKAGAGIYSTGPVTVRRSTLRSNQAGEAGGAIRTHTSAGLTVQASTISGNTAGTDGGAIGNVATSATIENSTITANRTLGGAPGGGIRHTLSGTITITNSTIAGNGAGAGVGANLHIDAGAISLRSTIVADPLGGAVNCTGAGYSSLGFNLESANTCGFGEATDLVNANPELGPLADNGGPTATMLPAVSGPAIDAGSGSGQTTDQRGLARTVDLLRPNAVGADGTDIGAIEHQDGDQDGVAESVDNCPVTANPGQANHDADALGDACDADQDNDGVPNALDSCALGAPSGSDHDADGCKDSEDPDQDNDGTPNASDACPLGLKIGPDLDQDGCRDAEDSDKDGDGVSNAQDGCPLGLATGPDADGDGCKDAEESDLDGDGTADDNDSCPLGASSGPDADGDGCRDPEDLDRDNDGVANHSDVCPLGAASGPDHDTDGCRDSEDPDQDGDGTPNASDACPLGRATGSDLDADGCKDSEDPDQDEDGTANGADACPLGTSSGPDADGDGCKDAEDPDDDGDTVADASDNCPAIANSSQGDVDADATGDACDASDDRRCTVPSVKKGSTVRAANNRIRAAGCTPGTIVKRHSETVRERRVIKLKPGAGTVLALNAPVKIVVSKGPR